MGMEDARLWTMVLCSVNQGQRAKRKVAMQILKATANIAVRILGGLNFAPVPILKVIRCTVRWTSSTTEGETMCFTNSASWLGSGPRSINLDALQPCFTSGSKLFRVVIQQWWLEKLSSQSRSNEELGPVERACAIPPSTITHWQI